MLAFHDKWHDDSIIDNYSNFEMFYIYFKFTTLMLWIVAFDLVFFIQFSHNLCYALRNRI